MVKKYRCMVCGYIHEGNEAPQECPVCHVGPEKFEEIVQTGDALTWADEHKLGVAQGVDPEILKGLRDHFNGECGDVGMYLAKLTDGEFLNNTNKAYLLLSKDKLGISEDEVDTSIGGMQLSLRFDFNGSTGIDGVQTETSAQGAIYDLYGRKLQSAPAKGIYIINGKKVLVK